MFHQPLAAQRRAIESGMGPVLVIAGPGAGKTFCLIGRVVHLITKEAMPPERICAVTFTNKAAEEIAARLKHTLGPRAENVTRGTLHSLCVTILREHGESIGLARGFGIADESYQQSVLRRIGVYSRRRFSLLTLFGRHRLQHHPLSAEDETVFLRYNAILTRRNMLDFDGIIARTAELLEKHREIARLVASRWDYVLVDEFQDLNPAQYFILKQLVRDHGNFFAVGDEEQSIFSWTGADPEILVRFQDEFDILEPIVLDRNRRCSRQIFEVARALVAQNPTLFDKHLRAEKESRHVVTAYSFEDEAAESTWLLADLIADRESDGERTWGDYALLYRQHRVGEQLEQWLVRNGIPCRFARGRSLSDDKVIRYVVASLRLVSMPDDPIAVDVFAEQVLSDSLIAQVRAGAASEENLIATMRTFARQRPKADPDARRAWRFIYHVENLGALYKAHSTLGGFVEELLAQRVGKYRNALEERHDELSDPAGHPQVVKLAERLIDAMARSARIQVKPQRGLEIALRGMLVSAGISTAVAGVDGDVEPSVDDMLLQPGEGGALGLALCLFKALQLIQSRDFEEVLEDYVAFDLETTDRDVSECEIVEVGAVKVRDGKVVDRFHSLVCATRPISSGARAVHGYSQEDLSGAPVFADVWPRFREFVGDDVLVAHNGQRFDVPVLRRVAGPLGGTGTMVFFDTLPLARSLYEDSARLTDLADRFGVSTGREHHALDDAETLAAVCSQLGKQKVIRSRKSTLVNLLDYLGLGLALDSEEKKSEEHKILEEIARPFALGRFSDCLEFYQAERERTGAAAAPTVEELIKRLGGKELMDKIRTTKDAAQRYPVAMARLQALIDASGAESLDESVRSFLERVALSTSQGAEVDPHRVNLLTLHSTKGLEFSRVYVVGVEDYQIPGYYAAKENRQSEIEEARRLLYVGMTRAEDRLVLTRVDRRSGRESGGSRFLEEMGIAPTRITVPRAG
ncbi:MAG: UvrD-helicase domain-containing protein [Gemmatimonadetes bacterium]|nr:UvrD-helicase domain-containing protein [Gemmatimonadota bacterium]